MTAYLPAKSHDWGLVSDRNGARLCENARTIGGSLKISSRFSAVFRHYRLGEAKKFAPNAPFSDNFRVFAQPGPKAVARAVPRLWALLPISVIGGLLGDGVQRPQSNTLWASFDDTEGRWGNRERHVESHNRLG